MHPLRPPFPPDKKRPVQFEGSQASILIPELLDVEIESAIRQMSAVTTIEDWIHVGSFCARLRFVPAATNSAKCTMPCSIESRDAMDAHLALKSSEVGHFEGVGLPKIVDAPSNTVPVMYLIIILKGFRVKKNKRIPT